MARKRNPIKDTTRNKNVAAAIIYLKGKYKEQFGTYILLAAKMGIDPDSITNVVRCHTAVSDSFIASLQEATDGIFNVHFLRGESDVMLAKDAVKQEPAPAQSALDPTMAALLAAKDDIIASKDEVIAGLKRELDGKDKVIAANEALIKSLQQQLADLRT